MFSRYQKIIFSAVIALAVFLPSQLLAATLSIRPATATYSIGGSFVVDVVVDSADQALNAVSGQLSFPVALLDVVSISKAGSILSYWVKEPVAGMGVVDFEGIVPNPGYKGSGGKVVTINFRAKQLGQAPVNFIAGSVLANDGAGTNILTDLRGGTFNLQPAALAPVPPPVNVNIKVPSAPQITSTTHPDPEQLYNKKDAEFAWPLKSDITGVNILADKQPNTDPGVNSDGLFSTYKYKDLTDGARYLHVKFRNSAGWGTTSHFKFSIDTVAPENLSVAVMARATTTDPRISLQISTTDELSGLDHYAIGVNDLPAVDWSDEVGSGIYELMLPGTGDHTLIVSAYDRAGNMASTTLAALVEAVPVVVEIPACPVLPVSWWQRLVASITPELLLAVALGIGAALLLILIGLILGRSGHKHHYTVRGTHELMASMHKVIDSLQRQKIHQINVLELAKTRRALTSEEVQLLEQLKRELTDLAGKLE